MLGNRNAGKSLKHLKKLADGGIRLGMRVVLCKDVNDGKYLDRTISDLGKLVPKGVNGGGFSLGVVPGRITRFRKKNDMPFMEPFTKEDCKQVVKQIEEWQLHFLKELGTHFVYPSDEFYAIAGIDVPPIEVYEEFLQFRNGVGSMALFADEFAYATRDGLLSPKMKVTVVAGMATAEFMRKLTAPYENVTIAAIVNNFYGEHVLHTSHLTGRDIIDQLKGKPLGDVLLLSTRCLRYGENVLVDGVSVLDISQELGVEVMTIIPTGGSFAKALKSL
jgi:NifB/MoaA-like Fe-S oxidoreductase